MTPDLETYLWDRIGLAGQAGPTPRDVIAEMIEAGMIASAKQAWRTLEKWADRGWYDYGVTLDLGWRCVAQRPTP